MTTDLRYPVGRFDYATPVTPDMRTPAIAVLAELPTRLRAAVDRLSDAQLDTPYRPGGWSVRQLVHHVADSHVNAYIRLKLTLTEHEPTIKPYDQDAWVPLADTRLPIETSLKVLDGIHARMTEILRSLDPNEFARRFHHPEIGTVTIDSVVQGYAWHSRHHVAHITALRGREGW